MEALTDKVVGILQAKVDGFIGSLATNSSVEESNGFRNGLRWAIDTIKQLESDAEFEEVARVIMKHLANGEKYHPHMSAIIESTKAELVEGVSNIKTDYKYVSA